MDTKDPELLIKIAEKIADNQVTSEELDFFIREFHKLVKNVKSDIQIDTLKAKLNSNF